MSVITLPKFNLGEKIKIRTIPVQDLPPLEVETPRQELFRLLDQAIRDRGESYVDKTHRPVENTVTNTYGCIMGYLVGLKGVSTRDLSRNGLDHYLHKFGWDSRVVDRHLVSTMIQMNDFNNPWGVIRNTVRIAFPVYA